MNITNAPITYISNIYTSPCINFPLQTTQIPAYSQYSCLFPIFPMILDIPAHSRYSRSFPIPAQIPAYSRLKKTFPSGGNGFPSGIGREWAGIPDGISNSEHTWSSKIYKKIAKSCYLRTWIINLWYWHENFHATNFKHLISKFMLNKLFNMIFIHHLIIYMSYKKVFIKPQKF